MNKIIDEIRQERKTVIQELAQRSRNAKGVPDGSNETVKSLYDRLDKLLIRLETEDTMTAEVIEKSQIDKGLRVIFAREEYHFPTEYVVRAKELYERWELERQSALEVINDVPGHGEQAPNKSVDRRVSAYRSSSLTVGKKKRYPPTNHPIYGVRGIMHGIAKSGKHDCLDDRYNQRPANVFGHNGLTPGDWYPRQLAALFRGAHGRSQGGIAGDPSHGAYSIIVSGLYDDLDKDHGFVIYYSGSGSHDNTDPKNPAHATSGTLALHKSLETQQPVRVLRSSGGKSRWSPTEGLRYDGLYNVTHAHTARNMKGGLYERFTLEYLDDKAVLERISLEKPTPIERLHFARIKEGF